METYLSIIIIFISVRCIEKWLQKKESQKCNYDCAKCRVSDCPNKECMKHRG